MNDTLVPELLAIRKELEQATAWAERIVQNVSQEDWIKRPRPEAWSPAECLVHLNITSERFLPMIRDAIREGRDKGMTRHGRFRKDLIGRLLLWSVEPPVRRIRVKTELAFVPTTTPPREAIIARFAEFQQLLMHELEESTDLDLNRLKIVSPFNSRIRYNLFSCFAILAAHQRRHLWQVEQAVSGAG